MVPARQFEQAPLSRLGAFVVVELFVFTRMYKKGDPDSSRSVLFFARVVDIDGDSIKGGANMSLHVNEITL